MQSHRFMTVLRNRPNIEGAFLYFICIAPYHRNGFVIALTIYRLKHINTSIRKKRITVIDIVNEIIER